jgi:hypothetical protein
MRVDRHDEDDNHNVANAHKMSVCHALKSSCFVIYIQEATKIKPKLTEQYCVLLGITLTVAMHLCSHLQRALMSM